MGLDILNIYFLFLFLAVHHCITLLFPNFDPMHATRQPNQWPETLALYCKLPVVQGNGGECIVRTDKGGGGIGRNGDEKLCALPILLQPLPKKGKAHPHKNTNY